MTGLVGMVVFVGLFVYAARSIQAGRKNRITSIVQWAFEGMYKQITDIIPDPRIARGIAPLALTMFFFVLISYWMSVLPGLDSIKWNGQPVLRSVAADLNFTFGLALLSLVATQWYAIRQLGSIGNVKRYLRNPLKDPIGSFEGLLELIGEFSRYTALSLRLFGNAFAGEVLLLVMVVLTSYGALLTLPVFIVFELFIGLIQAYIFFILTVIFTYLAVQGHGDSHSDHSTHAVHTAKEQ
ncbi:ATP synthase subunit A [Candidatus Saccharibacteria bacterium]|nr:MAG: ATP synthase subunit A [Candidatus Saccharibacteria bacterium]